MSFSPKERLLLKAKSSNLKPSSFKRSFPEDMKNLANNRLKNLKNQLQASTYAAQVNPNQRKSLPSRSSPLKSPPSQNEPRASTNFAPNQRKSLPSSSSPLKSHHPQNLFTKSLTNDTFETNTKNNFNRSASCKSADITNTPNKRNLAQERLQSIKKKLKSPEYKYKKSVPEDNSNKDVKVVTGRKRNISNICDNDSYSDIPQPKRRLVGTSPLHKVNDHNKTLKESNLCDTLSWDRDSSKFSSSTPISNRLIAKSASEGTLCTSQKTEILKPEPSNVVQTIDEKDNLFAESRNTFCSNFEVISRNTQDSSNIEKYTENTKSDDISENMEWTNVETVQEVADIDESIRLETKVNEENDVIKKPEKIKDICIVVDTNVFISGLSKIRDIVNLKTTGSIKPIVFVPWMVITELDYMKDSCSNSKLEKNVINAVKFINTSLKEENPRVIGQTVFEVEKQKHIGTSPDDKIMACCLQAAEKYEDVILLSNDTNLKSKAMINDITACSSHEIMMKLVSKLVKNTKSQKVMHKMGILCSSIICECMKEAYGNVWSKMDMMSRPPWSLLECLKRFKKYWTAVFREKVLKQCMKTVQDLQNLLQADKCICDDSDEFVEFIKLCVTFCIFLKDIEECRGFVENTLSDITKIP